MRLVSLDIPDEPQALARWLEGQLTGTELGSLVAELAAWHAGPIRDAAAGTGATLNDLLGPHAQEVMDHGLAHLADDRLARLLTQPQLLLDLQERVLLEGGPYWQQLAADNGPARVAASAHRRQVAQTLSIEETSNPVRVRQVDHPRRWWFLHPAITAFAAAAAAVLVMITLWQPTPKPIATAWGWNRSDALPQHLSAPDYLNQLAEGADSWFNKRPESAPDLARRLLELRQGCSTLLLSKHQPLDEADSQWLAERCRAWAAQFDQQLVALESGADPITVRDQIDQTVRKLTAALRDRATQRRTG